MNKEILVAAWVGLAAIMASTAYAKDFSVARQQCLLVHPQILTTQQV